MIFTCSICGEASTQICVRCTKDACPNHLCEKCRRCSDCCECELALDGTPVFTPVAHAIHRPKPEPGLDPAEALETEAEPDAPQVTSDAGDVGTPPKPEPEPDLPQPPPDPDPFPEPEAGLRPANED